MRTWDESGIYQEHLLLEHRRLEEELSHLQQLVAGFLAKQPVGDWRESVGTHLAKIREMVTSHFQQEEEGGCLEEAGCRAPKLTHRIAQLESEHVGILDALETLTEELYHCSLEEFQADFELLNKTLRRHEQAENVIMTVAFGDDLLMEDALPKPDQQP